MSVPDFETSIIEILENKLNDTLKHQLEAITKLHQQETLKAKEDAKQEFRDKFHIDPTKTYEVMGTELSVVIVETEHAKALRKQSHVHNWNYVHERNRPVIGAVCFDCEAVYYGKPTNLNNTKEDK